MKPIPNEVGVFIGVASGLNSTDPVFLSSFAVTLAQRLLWNHPMVALSEVVIGQAPPQPAIDDALLARARTRDAIELCVILRQDFTTALQSLINETTNAGFDSAPACSARRGLVRCFGSLIEGLADAMRTIAVVTCEFHGKDYNRFLQAKSIDRALPNHSRIYQSYRIIHEALPKSPLARLPDKRWDDLHKCLEVRNRIVHPRTAADLQVTDAEMILLIQTGGDFAHDFQTFAQWHSQKQQKLGWESGGQRRREIPKTGRNEKCPCGSQRKYKNCCAGAQYAA